MTTAPPTTTPRMPYPSDLTDFQWEEIELLLPDHSVRGRPRTHSDREILCAINYRWMTGCVWRMMPHDFPPWLTVYTYYRRWQERGLLGPVRQVLLGNHCSLESFGDSEQDTVNGLAQNFERQTGFVEDSDNPKCHPDRTVNESANQVEPHFSGAGFDDKKKDLSRRLRDEVG